MTSWAVSWASWDRVGAGFFTIVLCVKATAMSAIYIEKKSFYGEKLLKNDPTRIIVIRSWLRTCSMTDMPDAQYRLESSVLHNYLAFLIGRSGKECCVG